jgi:hypothetical protein
VNCQGNQPWQLYIFNSFSFIQGGKLTCFVDQLCLWISFTGSAGLSELDQSYEETVYRRHLVQIVLSVLLAAHIRAKESAECH